jgi:TonB family protein
MRESGVFRLLMLGIVFLAPTAHADLYTASQAYDAKDFPRAFELFRELAELGQPQAQETLAYMYVGGEGVKKDNVLGFAWAKIAVENGATDAQTIIDQLQAHVTPTAQKRIDELYEQFGPMALKKRVLPNIFDQASLAGYQPCHVIKGSADSYYPHDAIDRGIEGSVYIEFTVMPDGRARNPRVVYSLPLETFDSAARRLVLHTEFSPASLRGVPQTCTMAIMVRFEFTHNDETYGNLMSYVKKTKTSADSGDARSQMLYGLLTEGLPQLAKSRSEAMPSILKAAQAGLPTAQFMVGYRAMRGWGCECDEPKGLVWLHKAAASDQADAQVVLAHYLLRGEPDVENSDKALLWLERAAKSGNRDGKFYLAALLAAGADEHKRDPQRALTMLKDVMNDVDDDPTSYEIRAAAEAMLGKFPQAQKDQDRALKMAQKLGWETASQQSRLAMYDNREPWTGDLLAF